MRARPLSNIASDCPCSRTSWACLSLCQHARARLGPAGHSRGRHELGNAFKIAFLGWPGCCWKKGDHVLAWYLSFSTCLI